MLGAGLFASLPTFTPASLGASVVQWSEFGDMSAGALSSWTDKSGNANHWIQASGTKQPVIDGTGLLFDGSNDSMQCNGLASVFLGLNSEYTLYVIARPATVAAGSRDLLGVGNSASATPIVTHRLAAATMQTTRRSEANEVTGITVTSAVNETVSVTNIFTFRHITDLISLRAAGATRIANTQQVIGTFATLNRVSLGSLLRTTEVNFWNGYIMATLLISRPVTVAEDNAINTYFGNKYTVTPTARVSSIVSDSAHSWWSLPPAAVSSTALQGVWTSGVRTAGDIVLSNLGGLNDRILFRALGAADDHNTPSILMPSDKVPLVAHCAHNADAVLRFKNGSVIGDPHNLTAQVTKTMSAVVSYTQLLRQPGTDNAWCFTRIGTSNWGFTKTTDWNVTWGAEQIVFDTGGVANQIYLATRPVAADPDLVRCIMYGHPTASVIHDIYYCTIRLSTGSIQKVDGTVVGNLDGTNLPLNMTDLSKVLDLAGSGYTGSRLFDVSDGTDIEVAFAVWTDDTDSTYVYSKYISGTTWSFKTITNSGLPFGYTVDIHYIGGMTFPANTTGGLLYLSRQGSANVWTIEKKVTADAGDTWTTTVELTNNNDGHMCIRPYALPIGNSSGFRLTYFDCTHYGTGVNAYTDFAGSVVGIP